MGSTGTTKLVTVSVGVVWTAVLLHFVGPAAFLSLSDWLPRVYVSLTGWLTPPYLYLIINGIILSIAASSRFSPVKSVPVTASISVPLSVPVPASVLVQVAVPIPVPVPVSSPLIPDPVPVPVPMTREPVSGQDQKPFFKIADDDDEEEEEEFVIRGPRWEMETREEEDAIPAVYTDPLETPMVRTDSMEMPIEYTRPIESMEKPLVSSRFGRKSVRPSPEGNLIFPKEKYV